MILRQVHYNIKFYFTILTLFLVVICDEGVAQNNALSFNGSTDFVTFGNDSALYLESYTVECWFMRTGTGITSNTGGGGLLAYPLVTRGVGESDGNNRDLNYFMGIDSATNVLACDIEEGYLQYVPGLNHPVLGVTPILWNVWYHAAITFNANQVSVYLNGQLEMSSGLGVTGQSQSKQHAGVASGLNSFGTAKGFFCGVIDEVRVWDYVRTIEQIQNNLNTNFSSPLPGLVGAWGFNEIAGDSVYDASGNGITGTINGNGFSRVQGAPMNINVNYVPDDPATISPLNNDSCVAVNNAELKIHALDVGGDTLIVKYYGRPAYNSPPPFSIIPVPDTQHYVSGLINGTTEGLKAQTNWIVANRLNKNICYVSQLGDCVENGNNWGDDIEWRRADTAFSILENPVTTGLIDGIPYSICVGNHDQSGIGNPNGSTLFYNQFFGISRFGTRSYYGGQYGSNYDNHYTFFTASGMEFIDVSLEFDTAVVNPLVVQWADSIIQVYPNKRAIVSSHYLLNPDGSFSNQGQIIYDQLKDNPNFFLMLCGHRHDEGRRSDVFNGNTVHTIMSDYQSRPFGGNGWIKVMDFDPAINKVFVKTYSAMLDLYESDWNSEYTLDYSMTPSYQLIGTDTVSSGNESSIIWSGLQTNTDYEWYAELSDGSYQKTSILNKFSTNNNEQIFLGNDIAHCGDQVIIGSADTNYTYSWPNGNTNPFITVNQSGNYVLTATSIAGNCTVKDSIIVTINPIPQFSLGADTAACGQLILGSGVATNLIYLWQDSSTNSIFTALTSDSYSLYVEDTTTGCFSSDTIDVVIFPFPVVNLGSDTTSCGSLQLEVNATGNTYLWSTGSTNDSIVIDQTGNYILTATSIAGNCTVNDSILVTINPIPQFSLGSDTAACGQLLLEAGVATNFIYLWQDGSTDSVFTALTSDIYSLYVENSTTGCFSSDTIDVEIFPFPVVSLGSDTSSCGSLQLGVNATGATYLWSTGSTNDSILVNQTGIYFLTATAITGNCTVNDSVLVTINPIPQSYLGADTTVCGQLILGSGNATNLIYLWQDGSTNSVFTAITSDIYSLYVEDTTTGCFSSDIVDVVIIPFPVVNLGSDTTRCGNVQLGVNAPGYIYLWSTGSTNDSIVVNQTGNYILTVTSNLSTCVSVDSITVIINAIPEINMASNAEGCEQVILDGNIGSGYNYSWQNGSTQPSIVVDQSGEYIISVEDILTGCLNSDTTNVEIFQGPSFSLGDDLTCNKCNFNISAPAGYPNYLWNTGATGNEIYVSVPGLYAVSITDNNGCVASDSILIITSSVIYPNPVTDFLVVNLTGFHNNITFQLIDELAQLVNCKVIRNEKEFKIDCRNLAKGTYFLNITAEGELSQYKFIKL